jgi:hypothetical protein
LPRPKSLAAALRAAQTRPESVRAARQHTVREGCVATLGRALRSRFGLRINRELDQLARGPSLSQGTPTTVQGF